MRTPKSKRCPKPCQNVTKLPNLKKKKKKKKKIFSPLNPLCFKNKKNNKKK